MTDLLPIARQALAAANGDAGAAVRELHKRIMADRHALDLAVSEYARTLVAQAQNVRPDDDRTKARQHVAKVKIGVVGEGRGVVSLAAGFEHMAVTQAKSLLDFKIRPDLTLGDAKRETLVENSRTLGRRAVESEILSRWYARIAEALPPGKRVRQALDHKALKALLDGDAPVAEPVQETRNVIPPRPVTAIAATCSSIPFPTRAQLMGGRA